MLFKEVDDCEICPFNRGEENSECCNQHPDGYHPCEFMDKFGDMTIEDVISTMVRKVRAAEAYWENKWLAEQAVKEKNAEKKKKNYETRLKNLYLNNELTRIRRAIRAKRNQLSFIRSMASAIVFTEEIMNNRKIELPKEKHPLELEIEVLEARIREINKVKRERAKKTKVK